ncbi:glycosyltransferase 48 kDa subunit, partial [Striga asiatica]
PSYFFPSASERKGKIIFLSSYFFPLTFSSLKTSPTVGEANSSGVPLIVHRQKTPQPPGDFSIEPSQNPPPHTPSRPSSSRADCDWPIFVATARDYSETLESDRFMCGPKATIPAGFSGSVDAASLLEFVDVGHDLILAADASDPVALVINHMSYAVSETEGDHTLMASGHLIQSEAILGSIKIEGREAVVPDVLGLSSNRGKVSLAFLRSAEIAYRELRNAVDFKKPVYLENLNVFSLYLGLGC